MSPKSNGTPNFKVNASGLPLPVNKLSQTSPKPQPQPIDIAVIGSGVSGLALNIDLLKFPHIKVTIFEAALGVEEICVDESELSPMSRDK